jgi:hypothetical protein
MVSTAAAGRTDGSREVQWLVVESGAHLTTDGAQLVAGAATVSGGATVPVDLAAAGFAAGSGVPAVVSQVQSTNGVGFVASRHRQELQPQSGGAMLALALQDDTWRGGAVEATEQMRNATNSTVHRPEEVGWVALPSGFDGEVGGGLRLAARHADLALSDVGLDVRFGAQRFSALPAVFGTVATTLGTDFAVVAHSPVKEPCARYGTGWELCDGVCALSSTSCLRTRLRLAEETCSDAETVHTNEAVAYLAAEIDTGLVLQEAAALRLAARAAAATVPPPPPCACTDVPEPLQAALREPELSCAVARRRLAFAQLGCDVSLRSSAASLALRGGSGATVYVAGSLGEHCPVTCGACGPDTELARGRPVTADSALGAHPPERAVDGCRAASDARWISGDVGALHWLAVDLTADAPLRSVAVVADGGSLRALGDARAAFGLCAFELQVLPAGAVAAGDSAADAPAVAWETVALRSAGASMETPCVGISGWVCEPQEAGGEDVLTVTAGTTVRAVRLFIDQADAACNRSDSRARIQELRVVAPCPGVGYRVTARLGCEQVDPCAAAEPPSCPARSICVHSGPGGHVCSCTDDWQNVYAGDDLLRCDDATPPVLSCPPDVELTAAPGVGFVQTVLVQPTVSDNSGALLSASPRASGGGTGVTILPGADGTFVAVVRIGTYGITFSTMDAQNRTALCAILVTVLDEQPPQISSCLDLALLAKPWSWHTEVDLSQAVAVLDNSGTVELRAVEPKMCTGIQDGSAGSKCTMNENQTACAVDGGDCSFATSSCTGMNDESSGIACAINANSTACAVQGGNCVFDADPFGLSCMEYGPGWQLCDDGLCALSCRPTSTCTGDNDGSTGEKCKLNGPGTGCAVDGGDCNFTTTACTGVNDHTDGAACALNAENTACAAPGGDCWFTATVEPCEKFGPGWKLCDGVCAIACVPATVGTVLPLDFQYQLGQTTITVVATDIGDNTATCDAIVISVADYDECADNNGDCHPGVVSCINHIGHRECGDCPVGLFGNRWPYHCSLVDPCNKTTAGRWPGIDLDINDCDSDHHCLHTGIGQYTCECQAGFIGDGSHGSCEDVVAPELSCRNVTTTTAPGQAYAEFLLPAITITDNSGETIFDIIAQVGNSSAAPREADSLVVLSMGENTLRYSAADPSGNIGQCNFTVSVIDQEVPATVCIDITVTAAPFENNASIELPSPTVSENSGGHVLLHAYFGLTATNISCEAMVPLGCDKDMHHIIPTIRMGSYVREFCHKSCSDCSTWAPPAPPPCNDDPDGTLAAISLTCDDIVRFGCEYDLGVSLVSAFCPKSCGRNCTFTVPKQERPCVDNITMCERRVHHVNMTSLSNSTNITNITNSTNVTTSVSATIDDGSGLPCLNVDHDMSSLVLHQQEIGRAHILWTATDDDGNLGHCISNLTVLDFDECTTDNGGCSRLVACANTDGSRNCMGCPDGWNGNGDQCTQVNPCDEDVTALCSVFAQCSHIGPGQHRCACLVGYEGNGTFCNDTQPPQIECVGITSVPTSPASTTGTLVLLNSTATDTSMRPVSIAAAWNETLIPAGAPVTLPLGPNTITYTATDENQNSVSCDTMVYVGDTEPPVIVNCSNVNITAAAFETGGFALLRPVAGLDPIAAVHQVRSNHHAAKVRATVNGCFVMIALG